MQFPNVQETIYTTMRHDGKPKPINDSHLQSVRSLKDTTKNRAKKLLNIESEDDNHVEKTAYEEAVEELNESPAFNSSRFLSKARIEGTGLPERAISALRNTAEAIINPKAAIKARATKTTAGKLAKSRPYLSRQADLEFLEAHDELERAERYLNEEDSLSKKGGNIDQCEKKFARLEKRREDMRVAWVTARHVQRVRVVDVMSIPRFPEPEFFEEEDDCGVPEFQWGKWVAYKLLQHTHCFTAQYIDDFDELPFDFDTLRKHVERLIIVSAPIQTFISDTRRIYRWEDPARTAKWMFVYFFFWYISHIMTFIWGYICWSVIMNYYFPRSIDSLREGIQRSIDRGTTALKVGELMDQHGNNEWLGPLLEELGPYIQLQISDLVSFLEVLYNFYHFQSPPESMATLFFFATLFLISLLGNAEFTMRVFWFILGQTFFVCWPIASRFPRFRLLVSPFRWVFWDVPNHAEWSCRYLQARSSFAGQATLIHDSEEAKAFSVYNTHDEASDTDTIDSFQTAPDTILGSEERDILSFACTNRHTPGHLFITTNRIRFAPIASKLLPHGTSFDKTYIDLIEMSKHQTKSSVLSPLAKITTGMDKLELIFRKEAVARVHNMSDSKPQDIILLESMRGRDKAFNAIIGFSGLKWQHLQRMPLRDISVT